MQAREVDVAAIHDVDSAGLKHQIVQERDIRTFSLGNSHDARDHASQIQLRMQFHRRVLPSITRPRKDGQTEVDDRGVERVHGVRQADGEWL